MAPHLPAAHSESSEPIAAEADYEALTDALMQTRRGRWFLAEHARRCRETDHAEFRAALARIEQTLAEPRAPADLAEIQEKLEVLPRIEQALADYRDPPAMAELRESLGALARIEQTLAEPREPTGLAGIQEKLGALSRIEQSLAEPHEISGIAELHERVAAFAQTLEGVRAEVTAQRPAEPDEAERARDREREEEMLRLLHEQRERLDALADIWAQATAAPTAPEPVESEPQVDAASAAETAGLPADERGEPPPTEPQPHPAAEMSGISRPATAEDPADQAEPEALQASAPFDAPTSTADLLNQTLIFGPSAEALPQTEETMQADAVEDSAAAGPALDVSAEVQPSAPPPAADADPAEQTVAETISSQDDQAAPTVAETAAPTSSADPIVQMFIDAEPPASPAALNRTEPATAPDTSPLPEQAQLPDWLVGEDTDDAQTAGRAETDARLGDADVVAVSTEAEPGLEAAVDDDAALFEAEAMPETAADAETDMSASRQRDPHQEVAAEQDSVAQPTTESAVEPEPDLQPETGSTHLFSAEVQHASSSEVALSQKTSDPPDLAELTLDLLQKALFSDPARGEEPAPAADPPDLALTGPFTKAVAESDLRAAITALRRALGREEGLGLEIEGVSEIVVLDDVPVRPPPPASLRASGPAAPAREALNTPEPSASTATDPLAPVDALSEEERIALFS